MTCLLRWLRSSSRDVRERAAGFVGAVRHVRRTYVTYGKSSSVRRGASPYVTYDMHVRCARTSLTYVIDVRTLTYACVDVRITYVVDSTGVNPKKQKSRTGDLGRQR
jgi:hypothetical protein